MLIAALTAANLASVRYVDAAGAPTEAYPLNPNGSPGGLAGVQTPDGRVLALMPHPERVVTLESNSWVPPALAETWGAAGAGAGTSARRSRGSRCRRGGPRACLGTRRGAGSGSSPAERDGNRRASLSFFSLATLLHMRHPQGVAVGCCCTASD